MKRERGNRLADDGLADDYSKRCHTMKFRFLMGAGLAAALGAAVSAALAQQVTLISANGSLSCATHNGVQVSNNGAITIDVGSCDLGSGTGGEGGDPGGELPGSLIPSVSQISTQAG